MVHWTRFDEQNLGLDWRHDRKRTQPQPGSELTRGAVFRLVGLLPCGRNALNRPALELAVDVESAWSSSPPPRTRRVTALPSHRHSRVGPPRLSSLDPAGHRLVRSPRAALPTDSKSPSWVCSCCVCAAPRRRDVANHHQQVAASPRGVGPLPSLRPPTSRPGCCGQTGHAPAAESSPSDLIMARLRRRFAPAPRPRAHLSFKPPTGLSPLLNSAVRPQTIKLESCRCGFSSLPRPRRLQADAALPRAALPLAGLVHLCITALNAPPRRLPVCCKPPSAGLCYGLVPWDVTLNRRHGCAHANRRSPPGDPPSCLPLPCIERPSLSGLSRLHHQHRGHSRVKPPRHQLRPRVASTNSTKSPPWIDPPVHHGLALQTASTFAGFTPAFKEPLSLFCLCWPFPRRASLYLRGESTSLQRLCHGLVYTAADHASRRLAKLASIASRLRLKPAMLRPWPYLHCRYGHGVPQESRPALLPL